MKRTLFPTHALFYKATLIFSLMLLFQMNSFAQGPKWTTLGNSISAGDFIGPINYQPLVFRTNNIVRGAFTETGNFQVNNLTGAGNRFLQTDASGNIIPFNIGTSSQVLYGNGTWGSLPTAPSPLWISSGSNIYYNLGKVGIGTSSPLYPLDVVGDVRISNNLYVGGGIIITDRVNANAEVVTGKMKADSIVTDSTKGFYGVSKFNGDVKLQNKLFVDGAAVIGGDFKTMGNITFAGDKKITFIPGVADVPDFIGWGTPISVIGPAFPYCFAPSTPSGGVTANVFSGMLYSSGTNPAGLTNVMRMGYDGANGIIDVAGVAGTTPGLLLNYYCGMDVDICTGGGGYVATGKNFEVGFPVRTANIAVNVNATDQVGLYLTTTHSTDFNYNTRLAVNRDNTKALGVFNTTTAKETFVVYGNGNVGIGTDLSSNPNDYKLAVNGMIGAKELKIEITSSTWPDFVFEKNYKRMTLLEKEAFYLKEKHLPNIASKKEIEKNGLQISTVLSGITQNVEENTLDIVELYKKIIALENENQKLKKEIESLSK